MTTTTKEVLLEAARHIEAFGLLKGERGRQGSPCCAIGAIEVAAMGDTSKYPLNHEGIDLVYDAVGALAHTIGVWGPNSRRRALDVAEWNDDPDRTRSEVLATMRAAAECVE